MQPPVITRAAWTLAALVTITASTGDSGDVVTQLAVSGNSLGGESVLMTASSIARFEGPEQRLGNGSVRAYITLDPKAPSRPLEVGVAFSEGAMDGLPALRAKAKQGDNAAADSSTAAPHTEHEALDSHTLLLDLPSRNPTPFTFVQLDWNPGGHEPPGVYDIPHFDFHFWTASKAVRESIVPQNPVFDAMASRMPPADFHPEFYVDAAKAANMPAPLATVPLMGMHWLDVRSPELQGAVGNPEGFRPFTKTFIYGSWDGRFVFAEPMITRRYIMDKRDGSDAAARDEIVPVSVPARAQVAGWHPSAYRITYDAGAREYRVSLTQFVERR